MQRRNVIATTKIYPLNDGTLARKITYDTMTLNLNVAYNYRKKEREKKMVNSLMDEKETSVS